MSNANPWDLGGEGGNSFPFDTIGDSVTGTIESLREVQQTDLQTGEPKTFSNGEPMMMYQVTLANTNAPRNSANPADDGHRSVYLKGSRKAETQSSLAAVLAAVKQATGGTALEPGATLTLTYVGNGQQANRGFSPPKLYSAVYVRPAMNLGGAPQQQAYPAATAATAAVAAYTQQQVPQQPVYAPAPPAAVVAPVPQQQAYAPAPPAAPAAPAPVALSPEQIQALINAGVDTSTIPGAH